MKPRTPIHGIMAEFETPAQILQATRQAVRVGYTHLDAYTPHTVEGLSEELGLKRSRVPFVVLVGGLVGASVGFFMQYFAMALDYRFNVGGRPANSWPAFIPVTFELLVLVASFAAFFGMLFLNGLPRLYRPVFNVPQFARATQDRFFLCIEATDPRFDRVGTRQFLAELAPNDVMEVPH